MDFGTIMFLYGSPTLAVLIFVLNMTEIILLSRKCCNSRANRQQRRPVPIIFLMNLALSDLLVGLIVIVIKIMYFLLKEKVLPSTKLNLKVYHVLMFLFLRISLLCSVFSLTALTIDRYLAINNPMKYRVSVRKKQALIVSVMIWVISCLLIISHYHISFHTSVKPWKYEMVIFPATIIPSSVVFAICYICILLKIYAQGKELKQLNDGGDHRIVAHALKREAEVSKFAGVVVCIFMVCWLPVAIVGLILLSGIYVEPVYVNPVFILAFANSALDPLVYFGFKEALGRKLKRITLMMLRCSCRQQVREDVEERRSTALFSFSSASAANNNASVVNNAAKNDAIELDAIDDI